MKYIVYYQAKGHVTVEADSAEDASTMAEYEADYSPNFDQFYVDDVKEKGS